MKVTCPISGINYSISSPIRGHALYPHPMLAAGIKVAQLAEWYLADWANGDLPATETHLLGIALLGKLPVDSIYLPPMTESHLAQWDKFWSGNLEKLAKLAGKLEGKEQKFKDLPRLVVSLESASSIPDWLRSLESELGYASQPISEKAKELNRDSYRLSTQQVSNQASKLLEPDQIENLVLRALRKSLLTNNEQKALPIIISDWAFKVTEFPDHSKMRWQRVIQTIFDADFINKLLMSDIKLDQVKALEEHLMVSTPNYAVGTTHHSILMQRLADVIPVLEDFTPTVSARKKVNEEELLAALDGTAVAKQSRAVAPSGTGASSGSSSKPLTLSEKLALRLSAKKPTISAEDL